MKKFLTIIFFSLFLTNCATITGGAQYHAHVLVNAHPKAEIVYQGFSSGRGISSVLVKRNRANKFSVTVREKGCETQNFNYTTRAFRGWALAGNIFAYGIGGIAIDLITGALWKPSVKEPGIAKIDNRNFSYLINYTGCDSKNEPTITPPVGDKLVDVVYLRNGSIIRGALIDQDSTAYVKIQTIDGSIFVFKIEEVERVTRE